MDADMFPSPWVEVADLLSELRRIKRPYAGSGMGLLPVVSRGIHISLYQYIPDGPRRRTTVLDMIISLAIARSIKYLLVTQCCSKAQSLQLRHRSLYAGAN
jgi:hypothetical protein